MTMQAFSEIELRQEVHHLLDLLPVESIAGVRQFIVTQQIQASTFDILAVRRVNSSQHSTKQPRLIPQPASSLSLFATALKQGYEGDALQDTEALYDDV